MQLKNRQTKSLHNLNSNTNLPRYPFIPYQEGETSKTTPPTPRKSHVPRGDCYYICGRFSPFPGRSKTGSLIIYQGNKSARPSLRISHRRRAIISSWSKRFTIHRVSLYRILTTRSRKWRAVLEGWQRNSNPQFFPSIFILLLFRELDQINDEFWMALFFTVSIHAIAIFYIFIVLSYN